MNPHGLLDVIWDGSDFVAVGYAYSGSDPCMVILREDGEELTRCLALLPYGHKSSGGFDMPLFGVAEPTRIDAVIEGTNFVLPRRARLAN